MSCSKLNNGLTVTCDALERVGGINGRVWLGNIADISSYTIASNVITAISLSMGAAIYKFEGKKDKNSVSVEVQVGESTISFKQMLNLVLYSDTSAMNLVIEGVCKSHDLFAIVEANDGQFEVWGLDVLAGSTSYPVGGLNCESGSASSGVTIDERQAFNLTLSGTFRNMDRKFLDTDYATTIAAIEALE